MITGTLSRPSSTSMEFVQTTGLECCAGSGVLQIDASGALFHSGEPISSLAAYTEVLSDYDKTVRIAPDKNLPARDLVQTVSQLRAMGVGRILIITENVPS